jgi:hypothetical protein
LPILKEGANEINDALELLDNEFQIFLELKDKIIKNNNIPNVDVDDDDNDENDSVEQTKPVAYLIDFKKIDHSVLPQKSPIFPEIHFNQEFMQEFNDVKRLTKRYKDYRFKE